MIKMNVFGYVVPAVFLSVSIVLVLASGSAMAEVQDQDDRAFGEWYSSTMQKVESAVTVMNTGIEHFDCATCEAGANTGYEDATKALAEITGYDVSADMQPVKDHLTAALEDFKQACYHTELGAMAYDAEELRTAARYVNSSTSHFELIDELGKVPATPVVMLRTLEGNLLHAAEIVGSAQTPSPTPTPQAPGFEALMAVVGIVAVAFTVLWSKRVKGGGSGV